MPEATSQSSMIRPNMGVGGIAPATKLKMAA